MGALKKSVARQLDRLGFECGVVHSTYVRPFRQLDRIKGTLKGLTYVALSAWTFLLSQRTGAALLRLLP